MQVVAEQSDKFEAGTTVGAASVLGGSFGSQSETSSAPQAANWPPCPICTEPDWSWHGLSSWSQSPMKLFLDCACVLLAMPLVLPLMFIAAIMVRLTSQGPVLFRQERMGRAGRPFIIYKFRTMEHSPDAKHHPVTTSDNQRFTPIGPFLRRWKIDELPQILNVLRGDISLVGPRPKLPEHTLSNLPCRPGITGMATAFFANEEAVLASIPKESLQEYYHSFVLPLKHRLDADYMAHATIVSDLKIVIKSVLRRGNSAAMKRMASLPMPGSRADRSPVLQVRHSDMASALLQETFSGISIPDR